MNNLDYVDYSWINERTQDYWKGVFNRNKGDLMIDTNGGVYKMLPQMGYKSASFSFQFDESSRRYFYWEGHSFGSGNNFQYYGKLETFEPNCLWIPDPLTFDILWHYPYPTEPNLKTISYLLSLLQK